MPRDRISYVRLGMFASLYLSLACPSTAKDPIMVGGAPMYADKNIVENAVNSRDYTTLVAAVKAAGLVDTLSTSGPFTVFAPTNTAFAKMPAGTVDTLVRPENKSALTKILTYHVVSGDYSAADLVALTRKGGGQAELKTIEGDSLAVIRKGKYLYVKDKSGKSAQIIIADVKQSNGMIHVVDAVLSPGPPINLVTDTSKLDNFFPWPPPEASASYEYKRSVFSKPKISLNFIAERISNALDHKGYADRAYFAQQSGRGFVILTRTERIDESGNSSPTERWSTDVRLSESFSILDYIKALGGMLSGRFRVFAIVVTMDPRSASQTPMNHDIVKSWKSRGQPTLPEIYKTIDFTDKYSVYILIYEFRKKQDQDMMFVPSSQSSLSSQQHVKAIGLTAEDLRQ